MGGNAIEYWLKWQDRLTAPIDGKRIKSLHSY